MIEQVESLKDVLNPIDGQEVFVATENKYYTYRNGSWEWTEDVASTTATGSLKLNLYDLNKNSISQFPVFTEEKRAQAKELAKNWAKTQKNKFFLLYGKEIGYFTLFQRNIIASQSFPDALMDCLDYLGPIKAFDINEDDNSIEIWVEYNNDNTTFLKLFDSDDWVIVCG